VAEHRRPASRALAALLTLCAVAAAVGVPVASAGAVGEATERAGRLRADLRDRGLFAAATAHDPYRYTPADRLLTGLRGKDVVVAFVESYGRDAVEDPRLDEGVDAALVAGTKNLRAAGFGARSGWLGSPTSGGGSWLAHSTFLSGVRVDNQQRYTDLVGGDRLTLNSAFGRAGWRTVGIMPGVTRAWPEGGFYRYDTVRAAKDLGYRGPSFSWATMPDQYTLERFQRLDRRPGHAPVMAEIPLVSSHAPWTPLPELVPWEQVGDGSVFAPMAAAGESPRALWKSPQKVRAGYAESIAYSLTALVQWVQRYGDDDLVLVLLGDHQPVPLVTGRGASRDVPVTVVAHDPAVLDRISAWNWTDGMRPAHDAPVWPMEAFRDRFLAAYGPR